MRKVVALATSRVCLKRACIVAAAGVVAHTLGGHAVGTFVFKAVEAAAF